MKTKAIIFDIGGVIINVDMESCRQAFYTILGYRKIDLMLSTTHQRGMYGELEGGTVSPERFQAGKHSGRRGQGYGKPPYRD